MEIDMDVACWCRVGASHLVDLGSSGRNRRLTKIISEEALRPIEQRLALARLGDGEPHVSGSLDRRL